MENKMMWSCMMQLGMRMWNQHVDEPFAFDRKLWKEWSEYLADCGCSNIVLDIGEGLRYDSYPEISIDGAYTKDEMKAEIERLAGLGIEVVPKLNFSNSHNMWMGKYRRMVSSVEYYEFCEKLIDETCELFKPRYFHIGFDEEAYDYQKSLDYVVVRQNDLWWSDLCRLAKCVEKNGARAIVWADYARNKPDEFVMKLPKSVIPSVWYYYTEFENFTQERNRIRVVPFTKCNEHGFDQFPAGSNYFMCDNLETLACYCKTHIDADKLLGIMQTVWLATSEVNREKLFEAADTIKEAKAAFDAITL